MLKCPQENYEPILVFENTANYTTENTIYFPLLRQAILKYLGNTINNNFATS